MNNEKPLMGFEPMACGSLGEKETLSHYETAALPLSYRGIVFLLVGFIPALASQGSVTRCRLSCRSNIPAKKEGILKRYGGKDVESWLSG